MGLGLVGAGMGFGVLCAGAVLLLGGGWLWALLVYGLAGCFGLIAAAGLVLWRSTPPAAAPTRQDSPAAPHTGN